MPWERSIKKLALQLQPLKEISKTNTSINNLNLEQIQDLIDNEISMGVLYMLLENIYDFMTMKTSLEENM